MSQGIKKSMCFILWCILIYVHGISMIFLWDYYGVFSSLKLGPRLWKEQPLLHGIQPLRFSPCGHAAVGGGALQVDHLIEPPHRNFIEIPWTYMEIIYIIIIYIYNMYTDLWYDIMLIYIYIYYMGCVLCITYIYGKFQSYSTLCVYIYTYIIMFRPTPRSSNIISLKWLYPYDISTISTFIDFNMSHQDNFNRSS